MTTLLGRTFRRNVGELPHCAGDILTLTLARMALIRPRLTEHYGIPAAQAELDFAIPFLEEDIPLHVDPFLLWRSPSQLDQALHTSLLNAFNHLGWLVARGREAEAVST